MGNSIFALVPDRVQFNEFFIEIRKRNRWLILLRYGAVTMLASLIIGIYILEIIFKNVHIETLPLWIIACSILLYNGIFHKLWIILAERRLWDQPQKSLFDRKGFRSTHFALLQILLDFLALMLFIYFTGGIETPLFAFFIFHVVIGSLFLPGLIMGMIVTGTLLISISGALMEYFSIIPHHTLQGFLTIPIYNNLTYLIVFFTFFGITLYLSIYLANSVAKDLYRTQRSLKQAYQELEDMEKSKSRYVMSIVHDLKTPIAAVSTYLDMLLDGNLGELKAEHRRPLERSKFRLSAAINTINDILYISQLKLESELDTISEINLNLLFEDIYKELRILMASKEISYLFYTVPAENIMFKGEPKLLKLAFSNLISNAYKYTNKNGKIEVCLNDKENAIIITIADSGMGIPQNERDKIFHDFYRSSLSKKKGIEGTGLGMSIVSQILKRYNGTINVESPSYLKIDEENPGTQFTIELPKSANIL
jgi:signal transduction histidine kinase